MVLPQLQFGPDRWPDYAALPEDDRRELVSGWLVEGEVPTALHEEIIALLIYHLLAWSRPLKAGKILASGFKVKVDDRHGFMPDLQFFRADNPALPLGTDLAEGHPDLAVEVISPSTGRYDRMVKLQAYARLGIPEYWIIDPTHRELERLLLVEGAYRVDVFANDTVFEPETLPGLSIPLAELWG